MSRTGFDPQVHGFAVNNAWQPDEREQQIMRGTMFGAVLLAGIRVLFVTKRLSRFILWYFAAGCIVANIKLSSIVYGLCGGMAFTALDYYLLRWKILNSITGFRPTQNTIKGRILRDYIWKRT